MKRFRLVLCAILILTVGVVAALGLQARHAMQQELLLYHQVIAEDVFDNIETQLALFMRDEENRPFTHYSYYYVPDNQVEGSLALYRSPLADPPQNAPIVAYFQISEQGLVEFPHVNTNRQLWKADPPRDTEQAMHLCTTVNAAIEQTDLLNGYAPESLTNALAESLPFVSLNGEQQALVATNKKAMSARGNRSSFARNYNTVPQSKVSQSSLYALSNPDNNIIQQQLETYNELNSVVNNDAQLDVQTAQGEIEQFYIAGQVQAPENATNGVPHEIDVHLSSFSPVAVNNDQTLLLREVTVAAKTIQQGFLVTNGALYASLEQELQKNIPDQMWKLQWLNGDHAEKAQAIELEHGHFGFYHPLHAPFQNSAVFIDMPPQAEAVGMSERTLIVLALALLLAVTLGLWITDRMILVMRQFAERRQNFVAAVSHELKTPLTAIRMHAEMLEANMVGSEEKRLEYYQTMHAESQRLSRLIDNVLTLSRLEKNDCDLSLQVGDLRTVVQEAVDILAVHAQQAEFSIEIEADDDLPAVKYEHDALLQIIINCIDNAIKFSGDAQDKRVVICLKRVAGSIILRIRDFGPGIPQEYHKHVFESFYRGEHELTRKTKGTGIGLALVRKLALAMGVSVMVENCVDGGFAVDLQFQV